MNILISAGKTARFNWSNPRERHKMYGCVDSAAYIIWRIIKAYPEHTFYYVGTNDLDDVDNLPNLVNLENIMYDWIHRKVKDGTYTSLHKATLAYYIENNLVFDLAVVFHHFAMPIADYEFGYLSNKGTLRIPLVSEKQHAYIWYPIKELKIPYYVLEDDPREINHIPADLHQPKLILSQFNYIDRTKYYIDISNKVEIPTEVRNSDIPKLMLGTYSSRPDWRNKQRSNEFAITLNGNPFRFKYLQKWVFPYRDSQIVYGNWNSTKDLVNIVSLANRSNNFIAKPMKEIENELFDTKYTLVVPYDKQHPEFTTLKVWVMSYYGIIPFWCKTDYDKDNLLTMFPDYIKVSSPQELWHKIDELNNDESKYFNLLSKIYDVIDDDMFNHSDTKTRLAFDSYLN